MTLLAHGGNAGLAAELAFLVVPVVAVVGLGWRAYRKGRAREREGPA